MTHSHEQPPRNKHEMGTRPEEISVDALIKRIADERAAESGKHAKRVHSIEDEYTKTLDAMNESVNASIPAERQFDDTMDAFDKTFEEYGIVPENSEPAPSEVPVGEPEAVEDNASANTDTTNSEMTLDEYRKQIAEVTEDDLDAVDKEIQDRWDNYYENQSDDDIADSVDGVINEARGRERSHELSDDEIGDILDDVINTANERVDNPSTLELPESELPQESRLSRLKNALLNRDRAQKRKADRTSFKQSFKDSFSKGRERARNSRLANVSFFGKIMGRFNRSNTSASDHSEKKYFKDMKQIQYGDGEMSLLFDTKKDSVLLGEGSKHKYAKDFIDGNDMAIIRNEDGDEFGLAHGYIINKRTGKAYDLPAGGLDLTVGKKATLPGVGKIGRVQSVQLRYKVAEPGTADIQSTSPSPFKYYERAAKDLQNSRQAA